MTEPVKAPTGYVEPSLTELADRIKRGHEAVIENAKRTVTTAMMVGDALLQAKAKLKHGELRAWIKKETGIKDSTATLYMKLAKGRAAVEAKMLTVSNLGLQEAIKEVRGISVDDGEPKTGPTQTGNVVHPPVGGKPDPTEAGKAAVRSGKSNPFELVKRAWIEECTDPEGRRAFIKWLITESIGVKTVSEYLGDYVIVPKDGKANRKAA